MSPRLCCCVGFLFKFLSNSVIIQFTSFHFNSQFIQRFSVAENIIRIEGFFCFYSLFNNRYNFLYPIVVMNVFVVIYFYIINGALINFAVMMLDG